MKTATGFEIKTTRTITREQVGNLLASAFEGGSNYWYRIEEFQAPATYEFNYGEDLKKAPGYFKHIDYPLNSSGHLIISDANALDPGDKVKRCRLDLDSIQSGLNAWATSKTYAHHWRDFLDENDDATTADVFLQFCLFGDVIYG